LRTITGLKTFSSKLPWLPATITATSLPMTWTHTMVRASDWVGFTFPGMIEDPGSFSGSSSSPRPLRGPEPSQRTSLAIFISEAASVRMAPCANTSASWAASAANGFGAASKGSPVSSAILAATFCPKPSGALSPVPTAVPPIASWYRPGSVASMRSMPSSSWAT
jgi:hypothetical protein